MRSKIIWLSLIASLSLWGWERNGSPVCQAEGGQGNIRATALNGGRIAILWEDGRAGHPNYTLYMQVMDSTGQPLLQKDGIMIPDTFHQRKPQIATDGEYVYIVYEDYRGGFEDGNIYLTKINGFTGEKIGGDIPICTADGNQYDPRLCLSSEGGVWVCWQDYRSGDADVYIAKISPEGEKVFEVPVCTLEYQEAAREVVSSGEGCIVFWWDQYRDPPGLYGQRLVDSIPQWEPNGKLIIPYWETISHANNLATSGVLKYSKFYGHADGHGGAIVFAYNSAQRVDSLGNLLWNPPPKINCQPYHSASTEDSGAIGCGVAWGGRAPYKYFYLVKVTSTGSLPWGESLRVWTSNVWDTTDVDYFTAIASDYYKGAVTVFAPLSEKGDKDIKILRTDSSGQNVWEREICQAGGDQDYPLIVHEPLSKGYFVIWQDLRSGNWDIYGTYIDSLGRVGISERADKGLIQYPLSLSITPNPFSYRTEIKCRVSYRDQIDLKIYSPAGKLIKTLFETKNKKPGIHKAVWDGRDNSGNILPSGIYFVVASEREKTITRKVVLIR